MAATVDGDVLVSMGFVDPATGSPIETPDWSPAGAPPPAPPAADDDPGIKGTDPFAPEAAAQPEAQEPAAPSGPNWDDPSNPYKTEYERLRSQAVSPDPAHDAVQQLQARLQTLDVQANAAYTALVNGQVDGKNWDPQVAQAYVMAERDKMAGQLQAQADRAALLPIAREAAARKIAAGFSLPNAQIKPEELLQEPTVEAMQARAKTLQEVRRDQTFQGRKAIKADVVESSPATPATPDTSRYNDLSPEAMIRLGMLRGQQ